MRHVVKKGDTFRSIAQAFYQDASHAILISEANGFDEKENPPVGFTLQIPQNPLINVYNREGMYPLLDSSRLLGSYYPYLPVLILEPNPQQTNWFEIFLEVFIAAVIFYFEPALAGHLMFHLPAILARLVAYGLAGGLLELGNNTLQQLTAMAFHRDAHFSLQTLFKSALDRAELSAIAGAFNINPQKLRTTKDWGRAIGKMTELVITTQLARLALHQQSHFEWRDVVSSDLIQFASVGFNNIFSDLAEGSKKEFLSALWNTTFANSVNAVVNNQPFDITVYTATIMGTYMGTMAGSALDDWIEEHREKEEEKKAFSDQLKSRFDELTQGFGTYEYDYFTAQADWANQHFADALQLMTDGTPPTSSTKKPLPRTVSKNQAGLFSKTGQRVKPPVTAVEQQRAAQHNDAEWSSASAADYLYGGYVASVAAANNAIQLGMSADFMEELHEVGSSSFTNDLTTAAKIDGTRLRNFGGMMMRGLHDLIHPSDLWHDYQELQAHQLMMWFGLGASLTNQIVHPVDVAKATFTDFWTEPRSVKIANGALDLPSLFVPGVGIWGRAERLGAKGLNTTRTIVPKSLNELGPIDPKLANLQHTSKGFFPPYDVRFRPRNLMLDNDRTFVRVHGEDNQARSWMMRAKEIDGLTPLQIKEKFALKFLPKYISQVDVAAGTRLRVSVAGPQEAWSVSGGGIQYELMQRIPESSFSHQMPIYQPLLEPNYFTEPYENWSALTFR